MTDHPRRSRAADFPPINDDDPPGDPRLCITLVLLSPLVWVALALAWLFRGAV